MDKETSGLEESSSIQSYYEHDHDRLDGLLERFRELKRSNFPEAKKNFRDFLIGLKRHIAWEEEILFPMFEDKTGMHGQGPTEAMRMEHRQIKEILEAIHDKVRAQNPDCDAEVEALLGVLKPHNDKEEGILYPAIDQHLTVEERQMVFTGMEGMPEDKYHTCC